MLEINYRLYELSNSLDWRELERDIAPMLGKQYSAAARLVCGAFYLKSFFELTSIEFIERWPLCPYFRYFCGVNVVNGDIVTYPISHHILDKLTSQLTVDAYDTMFDALEATSRPEHRIH